MFISGTNSVAVDSVGTKVMGLDPDQIPLITEAKKRGFEADETEILGEVPQYHFRRAIPSLMDEGFRKQFPNVLVLAGHNLPHAPKITDPGAVTPKIARELEGACDGGCLAAIRSGFDYVVYAPKKDYQIPLVVIVGGGVKCQEQRYWFDYTGRPYTEQEIRAMDTPILTIGNCAHVLEDAARYKTPGCCSPSTCMLAVTAAMHIPFPLLSLKNKSFAHFGTHVVSMVISRAWKSLQGKWVDCPSRHVDQIYPVPEISKDRKDLDYIEWPLPKMDWKTRKKMIKDQFAIMKL